MLAAFSLLGFGRMTFSPLHSSDGIRALRCTPALWRRSWHAFGTFGVRTVNGWQTSCKNGCFRDFQATNFETLQRCECRMLNA